MLSCYNKNAASNIIYTLSQRNPILVANLWWEILITIIQVMKYPTGSLAFQERVTLDSELTIITINRFNNRFSYNQTKVYDYRVYIITRLSKHGL